jgi:hypothetical protein
VRIREIGKRFRWEKTGKHHKKTNAIQQKPQSGSLGGVAHTLDKRGWFPHFFKALWD